MRTRPFATPTFSILLLALAGACASPVGVSIEKPRAIHRYLTQSALSAEEPSLFSEIELRRYGLLDGYRTVRKFLHQVLSLIQSILAINADDIIQNLDVEVFGVEPRHQCGKHIDIVLFTKVHTERLLVVLNPAPCHTAARPLLNVVIWVGL
jgi:hypothetical protein